MRMGNEEMDVTKGDLVYIPSNIVHSIENVSNEVLIYIAATTPTFDIEELFDTGDLRIKPI